MKLAAAILISALGTQAVESEPAEAPITCLPTAEMNQTMKDRFGEIPFVLLVSDAAEALGQTGTLGALATYINPDTGSWTIFWTPDASNGALSLCIIAFGSRYILPR